MASAWKAARLAAIVLIACASIGDAQRNRSSRRPQTPKPEWKFSVTPYAWLPAIDGRVGVGRVAANIDLSVGDVLDVLRFAAMGYGEARYGRYVMGLDALYVSIGDAKTIAFRGETGELRFKQHRAMFQPVVGYAFGNDTLGIDALAGVRVWHISGELDAEGPARSAEHSGSRTWGDATGGVRVHWIPAKRYRVIGSADGGGGGARTDWQLLAGAGYDVKSWWTIGLGYRYLSIDYERSRYLNDTNARGGFLYSSYRF